MLYKNDLFRNRLRILYRLLQVEQGGDVAWVIPMEQALAWPEPMQWSAIAQLTPEPATSDLSKTRSASTASPAQKRRAKRAMERIAPLVQAVPDIFIPKSRSRLIEECAARGLCSKRTLYSHLQEFWRGGQSEEALLGRYPNSGRSKQEGVITGGRGRRPVLSDRPVYQLNEADIRNFTDAIERDYLRDERRTITAVFEKMLSYHYVILDGNGKSWILNEGQRPTLRQFDNFLRSRYSVEVRLRSRKGEKDFERDHRAKLGSARLDCLGVGHIYEIDASIADTYLVSSRNVRKIIGKPTIYLIIDRYSGLIVGFYVGLENASWVCAMHAILSISEDKAKLCERYGVRYDPDDWPAHEILPQEFFGDRGEMLCKASNQIADGLRITVTNMPALRPDWKPFVECNFKLIQQQIATVAPGYDPPANATKRRGKHYEIDACLTLQEFTKIVLEAILAHNRRPMKTINLTNDELMSGVEPSPRALWNHGIRNRAGLLTRYTEERVRFALMHRDKAVVTENGLQFRSCYYTCPEAMQKGWFVAGRKKRFTVDVSYDLRLVDAIYVHDKYNPENYFLATLTDRSEKFGGLSFAEVNYFDWLQKKALPAIEQTRMQVNHEFREATAPTVSEGESRLKAVGKRPSRSARRADTKDARAEELRNERQHTASVMPRTTAEMLPIAPVISLRPSVVSTLPLAPENPAGITREDKMKLARQRMLNG